MAQIRCLRGEIVLVDDADLLKVIGFRWRVATVGYAVYKHRKNGPTVYMHRLITGALTGEHVDHVSHNLLDNRRLNLRRCSPSENHGNTLKCRNITSSKFKGVSWNKKRRKWEAYVTVHSKRYCLGCFVNEVEAALTYNRAAIDKFGNYARLNEIK